MTGSLVYGASSFYGSINIDNLASMSSNGNMYIEGKVYDGLYTSENYLAGLDPYTAGPLIFTEYDRELDKDVVRAYLDIDGNFRTVNCVYEHAPSGSII